ncbi:MAG: transposase [Aquificota bacterium]|nr:transposase [Aquificota bacterium]
MESYDYISFEDLDIKGLIQNSNLAKLILNAGWGTLITFVTYKAVMAGARVVRVDPSYTTQDCSVCGFRVPKTLAQRLYKCPGCGAVMDRDYNASVNILQKGLACLKGAKIGATRTYACGEGGKPSPMQESPCGSSGWGKDRWRGERIRTFHIYRVRGFSGVLHESPEGY